MDAFEIATVRAPPEQGSSPHLQFAKLLLAEEDLEFQRRFGFRKREILERRSHFVRPMRRCVALFFLIILKFL